MVTRPAVVDQPPFEVSPSPLASDVDPDEEPEDDVEPDDEPLPEEDPDAP